MIRCPSATETKLKPNMKPVSKFEALSSRPWRAAFTRGAACLGVALLPLAGMAQAQEKSYTSKDVDEIVQLLNQRSSNVLSRAEFESSMLPKLAAPRGLNADLLKQLQGHANANQIRVLQQLAREAHSKAIREGRAKAKAKAIEDARQKLYEDYAPAHARPRLATGQLPAAAVTGSSETPVETANPNNQQIATDEAALASQLKTGTTNGFFQALLWSGAKLENPYSISSGVLKPSNSTTAGFIEIELMHRYVMLGDQNGPDLTIKGTTLERDNDANMDFFWPGHLFPDLDFRFGYVFNGTSTPTNLTTSTIAGGSDLSTAFNLGLPFWRWRDGTSWSQQATIELGGGFETDKSFLALHPNFLAGVGYQFHSDMFTLMTSFGLGGADYPRLTSSTMVATNGPGGTPVFSTRLAPTWQSTLTVKLSTGANLQLGATAYLDSSRPNWNLSAGLSVDLVTFLSKITK